MPLVRNLEAAAFTAAHRNGICASVSYDRASLQHLSIAYQISPPPYERVAVSPVPCPPDSYLFSAF